MSPNPENYCTIEIARRLVEAGIVVEIDHYYRLWTAIDGTKCSMIVTGKEMDELSYDPDKYECDTPDVKYLPAPSMAEVWRELPLTYNDCEIYLIKDNEGTTAGYNRYSDDGIVYFTSTNPTDALCELLIWVKGAKK